MRHLLNSILIVCALVFVVSCTGCGYSSQDNELIGQAKKIVHNTPILCSPYYMVDISLGVMRNGVGSMSVQDVWMTVGDLRQLGVLEKAVSDGAIVRVKYDEYRATLCVEDHVVRSVEIIQ